MAAISDRLAYVNGLEGTQKVSYNTGADVDIFIPTFQKVVLTIPAGKTAEFRDIIVLGSLTIQCTDADAKANLIARDLMRQGNGLLSVSRINANVRYYSEGVLTAQNGAPTK